MNVPKNSELDLKTTIHISETEYKRPPIFIAYETMKLHQRNCTKTTDFQKDYFVLAFVDQNCLLSSRISLIQRVTNLSRAVWVADKSLTWWVVADPSVSSGLESDRNSRSLKLDFFCDVMARKKYYTLLNSSFSWEEFPNEGFDLCWPPRFSIVQLIYKISEFK